MERGQADYVLSRIRELLAQQKSLEETGRAVGYCKSNVRKIALKHDFPRRTRFSPERRKQIRLDIRRARHTLARLAEIHGCSKSTMHRHAGKLTDRVGSFRPQRVKRKRVCGTCGFALQVWPCVACAAKGAPSDGPVTAK